MSNETEKLNIVATFEIVEAPNKENICESCVLRIGRFTCANRSLCPGNDGSRRNLFWSGKPQLRL
jgi:hypothetical protein